MKPPPIVGQVYRDQYPGCEARTIQISSIQGERATCWVLTDISGKPPSVPRRTTVAFKTLNAGYALVDEAAPLESISVDACREQI